MGVKPLLALASRAVAEVAWEEREGVGTGGRGEERGQRQVEAMRALVQEWRTQEEAAKSSCLL